MNEVHDVRQAKKEGLKGKENGIITVNFEIKVTIILLVVAVTVDNVDENDMVLTHLGEVKKHCAITNTCMCYNF